VTAAATAIVTVAATAAATAIVTVAAAAATAIVTVAAIVNSCYSLQLSKIEDIDLIQENY
jgi:hypothetical protein